MEIINADMDTEEGFFNFVEDMKEAHSASLKENGILAATVYFIGHYEPKTGERMHRSHAYPLQNYSSCDHDQKRFVRIMKVMSTACWAFGCVYMSPAWYYDIGPEVPKPERESILQQSVRDPHSSPYASEILLMVVQHNLHDLKTYHGAIHRDGDEISVSGWKLQERLSGSKDACPITWLLLPLDIYKEDRSVAADISRASARNLLMQTAIPMKMGDLDFEKSKTVN